MTYPYTFACVRGRDRVKSQYQLPAMLDWDGQHIDILARKMSVALSERMTGATIIWNILFWPAGNQCEITEKGRRLLNGGRRLSDLYELRTQQGALREVRALFVVAGSTDPADGFAVSQLLLLEKSVVVAFLKGHPTIPMFSAKALPGWAIGFNGDFMDTPESRH